MTSNPYAPPKAAVADVARARIAPRLWNPNAAANWSLVFSPAFGAFLHMKNWQALEEPDKATAAKVWFLLTIVVLGSLVCASVVLPQSRPLAGSMRIVGFLLLLAWYFGSARGQAAYVKTQLGDTYPRRGWSKPLGVAILVLVALIAVMTLIALVLRSVVGTV